MAETPGRPRVLHRRFVRDATEDEREHEREILKAKSGTDIAKAALSATLQRAPDLAILGGGYYLGAVMNMRPGIDIPLIGFVGFPDFGAKVTELQFGVDERKKRLEEAIERQAEDTASLTECQQACQERFNRGEINTTELGSCIAACGARKGAQQETIDILRDSLARASADLRKHQIAQGILMGTMIYAFTRPGFIAGIGEIIPG